MCGLFGVAGDITHDGKTAFNQGLYAMFLRGPAATGVASVNVKAAYNAVKVFKRCVTPLDLQSYKAYDDVVSYSADVLIGHTRAPTMGANKPYNAQPFQFGDIVGVHNGTLAHHSKALMHGNEMFDTDSESLYCNMEHNGVADTVAKLEGAWALVWYDEAESTLNFLRNGERSLFYVFSEDKKTLFWCSEVAALYWILDRNRIKFEKAWALPENTQFSWKVPTNRTAFEEPTRTERVPPPKKYAPVKTFGGYHTGTGSTTTGTASSSQVSLPVGAHLITQGPNAGTYWDPFSKTFKVPLVPQQALLPGTTSKLPFDEDIRVIVDRNRVDTNVVDIRKRMKGGKFRPPYRDHMGMTIGKVAFNTKLQGATCVSCSANAPQWGDAVLFLRPDEHGHDRFLCMECLVDDDLVSIAKVM